MRLHRRAAVIAAFALSAATVPLLTSLPTAAGGATAFSPPVALNDSSGASTSGAEPSIEVDSKGQVYVSAPAGVPTGGCPFWNVHPDALNAKGLPYDYRGTIDTDHGGVGGGDCDISITPAAKPDAPYDQVSVTSLSLANLTSNTTSDGGKSFFPVANNTSQQVFGVDRQWQTSDPTLDRHYLSVHDLATTNIQVSVSTDGGYQYLQNTPAINPDQAPGAIAAGGNHFGTTVVNPKTHMIYIPFLAPGPGEATGGNEHTVWIAEGNPCAVTACVKGGPAGPITWTDHVAYTAPDDVQLAHIFPAIAIDRAGTVYLSWTGDTVKPGTVSGRDMHANRIFLSHSTGTDVGEGKWSTPVTVDEGNNHSNMFPWLIAGAPGQVAAVWYGAQLGPAAKDCGSRTGVVDDSAGVNNNCSNDWTVQYAQSSTGTAQQPIFDVTTASPTLHNGSVCDSGTSCLTIGGDRTLLDFFDVALDPEGRPNIAYVSDTRAPGTADVQYTRLCSGTSLTGTALSGPCTPLTTPGTSAAASPTPSGAPSPSATTAPTATGTPSQTAASPTSSPTAGGGSARPTSTSTDGQLLALPSPVRVLDSRNATGTSKGRKRGDVVLDLSGRVPDGATAAVLNVTVTNPSARGYVVAYPSGSSVPGTSNVNFAPAQTQANEVVVPVPANRKVVLRVVNADAHVVADLVGYATDVPTDGAGRLQPMDSPVRVLDTRTTNQKRVTGAVTVDLSGSLPAGASAAVLNVTLTRATQRGYAVVFPAGSAKPGTSNVNSEAGQTQANEVLTRVSQNGRVTVSVDKTAASLVVDLVGYVLPNGTATRYVPLASPERAVDTRTGLGMSKAQKSGEAVMTMPSTVPADASAVLLNLTSTRGSRPGYVTVYGSGASRPATTNVNFARANQVNEVLTRIGSDRRVTLCVGGANRPATDLVVDVVGYVAPAS